MSQKAGFVLAGAADAVHRLEVGLGAARCVYFRKLANVGFMSEEPAAALQRYLPPGQAPSPLAEDLFL
eukprot:gene8624-7864_t